MTDADEALLWARESAYQRALEMLDGDETEALAQIDHEDAEYVINWLADTYRAGAAASVERIKELEEGLSMLYDLFTYVKPSAFRNGIADSTNTIDEGEVKAGLILDHAKALLKEPDQ